MQRTGPQVRIVSYACPIAGTTVYIRQSRGVAADGAHCTFAVCHLQDSCIAARRAGCGA